MSLRALQRVWYAKLKAFPDVLDEGPDGEGQLSDRGNLHVKEETPEEDASLAQRMADKSAYIAWCEDVLHQTRFPTTQEREVWRLHAQGMSERDIGTTLTIARRSVRRHLDRTRKRVGKVGKKKRWLDQKKQRRAQFRSLVMRSDPGILVKLVAVMMRQQGLS